MEMRTLNARQRQRLQIRHLREGALVWETYQAGHQQPIHRARTRVAALSRNWVLLSNGSQYRRDTGARRQGWGQVSRI